MSKTLPVNEIEDPEVSLGALQKLIERLRAPDGCPWDREQTLTSVRAYLVEEAHETAAALDSGDRSALAEELGDLLFQVVFLGRLGAEEGSFTLRDVAEGIHRKMVERHAHVFADGENPDVEKPADSAGVAALWERRKIADGSRALLAGVPSSLPALTGAYRLTQKAAGVGFDWRLPQQVLAKVHEELDELEQAMAAPESAESNDHIGEELGDLLFAVANLARHLGHDPEMTLARGNAKFRRRFGQVEADFADRGVTMADSDLETMDSVWQAIKAAERSRGSRE